MDLTIAQLAERTGVAAGTLRMWEARYSFPRPTRLPSGHRRYSDQDAELVQQVLRYRDEGLSLPAAIARMLHHEQRLPASIFAGLHARRPELATVQLDKPGLLAVTRAIEDERLARAAAGALIGSFQQERFYRQTERRWQEIGRSAEVAVALADFSAPRADPGAVAEVAIAHDEPLAREWSLVSDAPGAHGCVAGWEMPTDRPLPERRRRFEVLFSAEPEVVRVASEVAIELIQARAPSVAERLRAATAETVRPSPPDLRAASALTQRAIGYLGAAPL